MMADWGMTLGGWIWMGVWIVALLVMIWLIVGGGRDRGPQDDPQEILRARFARGEISREEYEQARRLLETPLGGSRG